ncbi:MAG: PQQ-like beta-propeller repeat protein, partial [Verrucomicrobiae bacterium]|nr:PQQ-like beta-propeller repeat protein [Verrucomicrobiae bacterium]
TGAPIWTHSYDADYSDLEYDSGPRASVTIAEGRVWTLGTSGKVHCLDAASGNVLWSIDGVATLGAKRPKWGFAASPVLWKDTVIVHLGVPGGGFVAFDKLTGEERWRGSNDPAGYCTPVFAMVGDQDRMIAWTPEHIQSIDPESGQVIWEFPYEITYGVSIATPIVHEGLVFVAGYWHGSKALRLSDGSLAWEDNDHLRGLMSQPLYRDGVGWLLDKQLGLVAFDWKSGRKLWDDGHSLTPQDRNPQVNLVRLGETDGILALNANGELIHGTLTAARFEEAWREQLIGKTWAHPAFSGDLVFARDDRSVVAARLPVK